MNHIRKKTREYINSLTTSNMPKSRKEIVTQVKKTCSKSSGLTEEISKVILEEFDEYY